jgi:hypothetical protein
MIGRLSLPSPDRLHPAQIYAASARGRAAVVDVDGTPAVRTERVRSATGDELANRRVEYMVCVPDLDNTWLTACFSISIDGDPLGSFGDVLTEMFDAIVGTLRWTGPQAAVADPPR